MVACWVKLIFMRLDPPGNDQPDWLGSPRTDLENDLLVEANAATCRRRLKKDRTKTVPLAAPKK